MREDMRHVIIDRPRIGGDGGKSIPLKGTKRRWQRVAAEDYPRCESTARERLYGWMCKQLNEHLAPLRRWLRSNCGRPWNDVYSEICEHLRIDSALQAHVRDHAREYVLRDTCLIDGEICDSKGKPIRQRWFFEVLFYVDPRDGTLQEFQRKRTKRRKTGPRTFVAGKDRDHHYRLIDGIWYEFQRELVPPGRLHVPDPKNYPPVYIWRKRQLGKLEIRKLRLWQRCPMRR